MEPLTPGMTIVAAAMTPIINRMIIWPSPKVMEASALAYMLPLAGFIAGLAAGWGIAKTGAFGNGELLMALCAIIGTAAAYFIMRALDPKLSKGRWEQRIISITPAEESASAKTEN